MDAMLASIRQSFSESPEEELTTLVVNAPFQHKMQTVMMGLGIIVLLIYDESDGLIHRVALSKTEMAEGTVKLSDKKFEEIKIPISYPTNIIAKAIRDQKPYNTVDWRYLFEPALTAEQARFNQTGGTIACSYVYPLHFDGHKGAMIFSFFQHPEHSMTNPTEFMQAYADLADEFLTKATAEKLLARVR